MSRSARGAKATAQKKRLHRQEPLRTGPRRGTTESSRPAGSPTAEGPSRPAGIVEQSVETAYRVFAEYLERGQKAAARFGPLEPFSDGFASASKDLPGMTMRYFQDMAQMWLGPVAQLFPMAGGVFPGSRSDSPWDNGMPARNQAAPEPAAPMPERQAFSIEVSSAHPTEVALDLKGRLDGQALSVQALHAVDGAGKPPLSAVSLVVSNDRLRISLVVPSDQPAGIYSGVVFDSAQRVGRGTLTVSIQAPA
jgi:hypothetical protein